MSSPNWKNVSKSSPCEICGHESWCATASDGGAIICRRIHQKDGVEKTDAAGITYYLYQRGKNKKRPSKKVLKIENKIEKASSDFIHDVYSAFIEKLPLIEKHQSLLKERGFTDQEISKEEYRSIEPSGLSDLCKDLRNAFGDALVTVPGFSPQYINSEKRILLNVHNLSLAIPVYDLNGKIKAIKLRNSDSEKKYTFLSSSAAGGPSATLSIHASASAREFLESNVSCIGITEGELKAAKASLSLGFPVLSIPGVGSYKLGLDAVKQSRANKVKIYFDSDFRKNKNVCRSLILLCSSLLKDNREVICGIWDNYKGIDDALLNSEEVREVSGDDLKSLLNTTLAELELPEFDWKKGTFLDSHISEGYEDNSLVQDDTAWLEPIVLPSPTPQAPILQPEMIPTSLREWALDCAERMQAPLDFLVAPLLVSMSILIGRQLGIRPKQFDSWTVIPNLWGMIIGRPSALKTPCQKQALKFIENIAEKLIQDYEEKLPEWRATEITLNAQKKGIEDKIKTLAKEGKKPADIVNKRNELLLIEREIEEKRPRLRRLYTSDATQEILGVLSKDNPNGLGVFSDELITIFKNTEKTGREGERSFFLTGWSGDGRHTVDRITRGHINIPSYCISLFGNIQPGVLNSFLVESEEKGLSDDGFIQRFQIMLYPEADHDWKFVDKVADTDAQKRVLNIFENLLLLDLELVGATSESEEEVPFVKFSSEAQEVFKVWLAGLERRLRNDDLSQIFEGHLGKYRSLLPSLALIFHIIECVGSNEKQIYVSMENTQLALEWCDFLESHAKKVFAVYENAHLISAIALLEKIKLHRVIDGQSIREIYRNGWSGLNTDDSVLCAVETLNEYGWARVETLTNTGGAPSKVIRIHPSLR